MGEHELADIAARLYALPFDDFVAARTAAAKDHKPLGPDLRSLPKPSVAAWTVNMLAALRPEILRELAGLGQSMRAAQAALDAAELRRLGQQRRQLLSDAVKSARAAAEQQGRKISPAIATEVEQTLRAATADEAAAAAVQSGRLLRVLSADGVDVVDLTDAVALPSLVRPAADSPVSAPAGSRGRDSVQPRLRAVGNEPRTPSVTVTERARARLAEAEQAARSAEEEAARWEEELSESTALATGLAEESRSLRERLERTEQDLKAARKRRELAAARAQQAARAADKERRTEVLARERVLRLGNTPEG
jgi:hypothetical protein